MNDVDQPARDRGDGLDLHDDQWIGDLLDQVALQIIPNTVPALQVPLLGLLELDVAVEGNARVVVDVTGVRHAVIAHQ